MTPWYFKRQFVEIIKSEKMGCKGEGRLAARVRDTEYARDRRKRPSPAKRQKDFKAVAWYISQWLEPGWGVGGKTKPEKN